MVEILVEILVEISVEISVFLQVRKYFQQADTDKDGKLTKTEWMNVLNYAGVKTTM